MSAATSASPTDEARPGRLTGWLFAVAAVTFLAGLLFGYDQGVISAALPLLTTDLALVGLSFTVATGSTTPAGSTGMTVDGLLTLIALVVFIASFAFSLGPITWTMIAEIFPTRVRGKAVALATAVNWGAAFLVTQFFLSVVDAIGESTTFFLFAALCVIAFVWVGRRVPETRGRSLEEIQALWEPAATVS